MNSVHLKDYEAFNSSFEDYLKRYYNGHHSPVGNRFFAFSIKKKIIESLDLKRRIVK